MQTCKDLELVVNIMPKAKVLWDDDDLLKPILNRIKIPSGTYVQKMQDRYGKEKLYRVKPWRGMPKEYKEMIDAGVVISHAYVKGRI